MYANWLTFVFTHTINQTRKVLEEDPDTTRQICRRFNCTFSFVEIQLLWCYPSKDGSCRALCHVEHLFWWKVISGYTDWVCHMALMAYWTYRGTPWRLSSSVGASLLDHQSPSCSQCSPLPLNLPLCDQFVHFLDLKDRFGCLGFLCTSIESVFFSSITFSNSWG